MAARLPTPEKRQAPLVQAHAFDHYLHGACDGRFPIDDARSTLRCPLCLRLLDRSAFNLEHAPQRGGQSRLGQAWVLVAACERCNGGAGGTFESAAAAIHRADARDEPPECEVHGTVHGAQEFDLEWMPAREPVTVADVKSAYLIAFAVLGYSWVTAERLSPIRSAFKIGAPPGPADVVETCGLVTDPSRGRTVIEVVDPLPLILVVAPRAQFVVALPSPPTVDVLAACERIEGGPIRCRNYRWPLMVRDTQRTLGLPSEDFAKPEEAWDRGATFHLDRCESDHSLSANPLRVLTRSVNAAMRRAPMLHPPRGS